MVLPLYVTGNANKLREARAILGDGLENVEIDLPEYQGDERFIVSQKARLAAQQTGKPVFVDDVSLRCDAWGGMPGPYIKFFLKSMPLEKLALAILVTHDTGATAICNIAYCSPGKEPEIFTGEIPGKIVLPRGEYKFGWDPIFLPRGYNKTFGEMTAEEKNAVSHRRLALESFKNYLSSR